MDNQPNHSLDLEPTANYSSAIAKAVEWLGDRYLLAKPINAVPNRAISPPARNSSRLNQQQSGRQQFRSDVGMP
jgi:hypothetical protein